eukprot:7307289-Prymnesium_polylepis.1
MDKAVAMHGSWATMPHAQACRKRYRSTHRHTARGTAQDQSRSLAGRQAHTQPQTLKCEMAPRS